jgi:hypothetical protein
MQVTIPRFRSTALVGLVPAVLLCIASVASAQTFPLVPAPIPQHSVDELVEYAGTSPDQRDAIRILYGEYDDRHRNDLNVLWAEAEQLQSAAVEAYQGLPETAPIEDVMVEAHQGCIVYRDLALAMEREFLAQITGVLTTDQRRIAQRWYRARLRRLYQPSTGELPLATVDPFRQLVELRLMARAEAGEEVRPSLFPDMAGIPEEAVDWLDAAEVEYVQLLLTTRSSRERVNSYRWKYNDIRAALVGMEDPLMRAELSAEAEAIRREFGQTSYRISRRLNRFIHSFLAEAEFQLPEELFTSLHERVLTLAYDVLYADPCEMQSSYAFVLAEVELDPTQEALLRSFDEPFARRHRRLTDSIIEVQDEIRRLTMESPIGWSATRRTKSRKLAELLIERQSLNSEARAKLLEVLSADQVAAVPLPPDTPSVSIVAA